MKFFPEHIKNIAVIAPAGQPDRNEVQKSLELISSQGYNVSIAPNVFAESDYDYLASSIENRVSDIHACWRDKSIDLIIAAKGGFGSAQLLPYLNWDLLKSRDIPFIGYSDLTALHLGMFAKGVGTPVSGPMFTVYHKLVNDTYTLNEMYDSLSLDHENRKVSAPGHRRKLFTIKPGEAKGKIIPVTLSVLASAVGTDNLPDFKNKILLIEDINEPVYKLDRYLTHLFHSGILGKISGLLCGYFTRCGNQRDRIRLFRSFAKFINGPVIMNIPFGHSEPRISVAFGAECIIKRNEVYWQQ